MSGYGYERHSVPLQDASVSAFTWGAKKNKAVVIIVHGLAEHAARYDEFARVLNAADVSVAAYDQRGHGLTGTASGRLGFVSRRRTWDTLLSDLNMFSTWVVQRWPQVPVFVLGHSMGSLIVRCHLRDHFSRYAGAILSGTAPDPGIAGRLGKLLAAGQALFLGKKHRSGLLNTLVFGKFAAAFSPARTPFDWLSRDRQSVDAYIADSACGFVSSASLFHALLQGTIRANQVKTRQSLPHTFPLLWISGDQDPVGNFGVGVHKVVQQYRESAAGDSELLLYSEGRHEMLQEINRIRVYSDIRRWLQKHMSSKE